ncbi:MAG: FAD-dependent oxidoreductase [Spirochaetales bacterium]|nr:FAD-dependent oxidoreductase [Spirochaetales bacterium]
MRYIMIGGVAGGAAAAARLRRNDEKAEVVIYERGEYISYANCGLPYYLGEVIKERESLFVESPESFKENLNIDVNVLHEVISIDRLNHTLKIKDLKTGELKEDRYDKLVLSPGAEPFIPPVPGADNENIFSVRGVPDIDRIKKFTDESRPSSAVIVGGGFIGIEIAENLAERGVKTSIVELLGQVMTTVDFEMASMVHEHLKLKGIGLFLNEGIKKIEKNGKGLTAFLNCGTKIDTDMIIFSAGIKPEISLAVDAGLVTGRGIRVNEYMQTTDPDIYAVGDAVETVSPVTGKYVVVPLAGPAGKQARIAADNIAYNAGKKYKGAIGTAVARVFDLTVASTGYSEKALKRDNIEYKTVITHGFSHAGYYPGAMPLTLKLIFSPQGKLYGGQVIGYDGADKRIEMIASVLRFGGSVNELTELEQAYAPPYSSSKDPVNILGFTAENLLMGRSDHITWAELKERIDSRDDSIFLLDVRTKDETELHRMEGALNIPKEQIRSRLNEIPKDKKIIVLCMVGLRSYLVERVLKQNGYDAAILSGGLKIYFSASAEQDNRAETLKACPIDGEMKMEVNNILHNMKTVELDACGLQCPGPIMKLKKEIDKLAAGERIIEKASDPGFEKDIKSWCNMTGNTLVSTVSEKGIITAVVEKGAGTVPAGNEGFIVNTGAKDVTLISFSDDMDKALASLVIANGALSAGKKVTIFYTFWGLNIIKKVKKPYVKKGIMGRMFSIMLPSNNAKLKLSKMNMGGMGSAMMRMIMKSQKIDTLNTMLENAVSSGIRIIACQMSMDVMGVKREELIDAAEIGGVANYLESASDARINLFI